MCLFSYLKLLSKQFQSYDNLLHSSNTLYLHSEVSKPIYPVFAQNPSIQVFKSIHKDPSYMSSVQNHQQSLLYHYQQRGTGKMSQPQYQEHSSEQNDIEHRLQDKNQEPSENAERNKKLLILDSYYSKEKLLVIDLQKIQNNLYDKFRRVYSQINRDIGKLQIENELKQDDGEEKENSSAIDQCLSPNKPGSGNDEPNDSSKNSSFKECLDENGNENHKPESEKDGDLENAVYSHYVKEEAVKQIKKIALASFQHTLQARGYKMSNSNSFVAEGGFGTVLRVYQNGQKYACKVISNVLFRIKSEKCQLNTVKMRSRFLNEVEIMRRVSSHPNIVSYIDHFSDELSRKIYSSDFKKRSKKFSESGDSSSTIDFKNCFIVMEYANGKTLSYYIKNRRRLSEDIVKTVVREVGSAVEFLHQNQIAHRDIKLSNLLLQRRSRSSNGISLSSRFNFVVKLCDFGLSSIVMDNEDSHFLKPVGTSLYMAPEILRSYYYYNKKQVNMITAYCGFKGDIWALGVCMFYCLHGYYPLDILCQNSKQERIVALDKIFGSQPSSGDHQMANDTDFDDEDKLTNCFNHRFRMVLKNYHYKISYNCKDLLSRMLEVEAKKRAQIDEVMKHCFLC